MRARDKKKILDEGGKLPDKEAHFWNSLSDSQKRDLTILPVLLHEALSQTVEGGTEVAGDILHFLNVSASKALMSHSHPKALAKIMQSDCNRMLKETKADDSTEAALVVAYLVLQLVEEGRIPAPDQNQVVLASMAIMEEAKQDGASGGWRMNGTRVAAGCRNLRERLEFHGYLTSH